MRNALQDTHNAFALLLFLKATESTFIFPNIPDAEVPSLRSKALHAHVGKVVLTNQPDWPFPPFLKVYSLRPFLCGCTS